MKGIQYQIDEEGNKTAIVIPMAGHEEAIDELIEGIYGHEKIQERRNETTITREQFLKDLKDDGLL